MKSQLQQASFADEEIDKLSGRVTQCEAATADLLADIGGRFETVHRDLAKRREAEGEIVKLAGIVEDLRLHHEVLRASAEGGSQNSPEVELLRLKVAALEESSRDSGRKVTRISEEVDSLNVASSSIGKRIREEVERLRNSLGDSFVDAEAFAGLRNEMDIFRDAQATNLQAAVEERDSTREQIEEFRAIIQEMRHGSDAEAVQEVIGGHVDSRTSSEDVRKLEQKIQGIDSKVQRDLRKLKGALRKLERAFEEAEVVRRDVGPVQPAQDLSIPEAEPQQILEAVQQAAGPQTGIQPNAARIHAQIQVIQDDFQLFFVLMMALLAYFVVANIFNV
jgi:hypothetical protein